MKLVRFVVSGEERPLWGVLEGDSIRVTDGLGGDFTGDRFPLAKVSLKAPAEAPKIVCVGKNYVDPAKPAPADELPKEPGLFLKAANALADPEQPLPYPSFTKELAFEGELAVVIGRMMKKVRESDALDYVLGYSCAIDITAKDCQKADLQWVRAKSADRFCPLGPWIETDLSPQNVMLRTRINGEVRQESSTAHMIFPVAFILSYISSFMTLLSGDVVLTGTPKGAGPLQRGDVIEVSIEGIGTLKTPVV